MKISHDIADRFGPTGDGISSDEVEAGMLAKSREFAEAGNRIYLPVTAAGAGEG